MKKQTVIKPNDTETIDGVVVEITVQSDGTVILLFPNVPSNGPGTPPLQITIGTIALLVATIEMVIAQYGL